MGDSIPRKLFYKIGEVCQLTDTQPYVLRFWESEFPQLAPKKSPSGQRVYRRKDFDLVMEIKKLLYEQGYTIAGARKRLGMDGDEAGLVTEDLFPVPANGEPESAERPIRGIVHELQEILRILDQTDRRVQGRRATRQD